MYTQIPYLPVMLGVVISACWLQTAAAQSCPNSVTIGVVGVGATKIAAALNATGKFGSSCEAECNESSTATTTCNSSSYQRNQGNKFTTDVGQGQIHPTTYDLPDYWAKKGDPHPKEYTPPEVRGHPHVECVVIEVTCSCLEKKKSNTAAEDPIN